MTNWNIRNGASDKKETSRDKKVRGSQKHNRIKIPLEAPTSKNQNGVKYISGRDD